MFSSISSDAIFKLSYFNETIATVPYTNFLCLVTDDTLNWDNHTDHLISRLNSACYAVGAVKAKLARKAFRMLYFPYAHSVIF
jgi:hypothetical protein